MRNFWLLILLFSILVVPPCYGLAASYGEGRVILRPVVPEGETVTIDRTIRVKNVNDIPVKVTFEPTERFKKIIQLIDEEIILQPEEMKLARFKVVLKSGGKYEGKIIIKFMPEDPEIKTNSAAGSSSMIIIAEGPVNEYYYEVMGDDEEPEEEVKEENPSERDSEVDNVEDSEMVPVEEQEVTVGIGGREDPEPALESDTRDVNEPVSGSADFDIVKPLIGVIIVVVIVGIGLAGFFFINKKK